MKTQYINMNTKLDSSYDVINDEIYKAFADDKKK